MRTDGISFASLDNGTVTETDIDLMTPFLSALDSFTNESFNGVIKTIVMDDEYGNERQVYFKHMKVHGEKFKMVAVFSKRKSSFKQIDSKMLQFKWAMQEKGWHKYLTKGNMPDYIRRDIKEKIDTLFEIA